MTSEFDHPLVFFVVSFLAQWLAAWFGLLVLGRRRVVDEAAHEDFDVVLAAALALFGLIIGFSFSMAVSRYDVRKNCEEAEANAIGTEFVRADLLPSADAMKVRSLLRDYLDQRVLFYTTHERQQLREINARTSVLQSELWSAVRTPAAAQPNPVVALTVAGMNDVLNSQGYTQAAWWNRIPRSAWSLMGLIAVCCNVLLGYGSLSRKGGRALFLVMPLIASIAFFLIADIDSPRGGLISVNPENLSSLATSLGGR